MRRVPGPARHLPGTERSLKSTPNQRTRSDAFNALHILACVAHAGLPVGAVRFIQSLSASRASTQTVDGCIDAVPLVGARKPVAQLLSVVRGCERGCKRTGPTRRVVKQGEA